MGLLGLAKDVLEKVMGIAESSAVNIMRKLSRQVRFSVNKMDITKAWDETSVYILIEKEKKMLIYDLSLYALGDIEKILGRIEEALKIIPPKPYYAPLPKPAEKYPSIPDAYDRETIEKPEKMVDTAKMAIDSALSEGVKKVAGTIYTNAYEYVLVTSAGFEGEGKYTNTYLDVRAFMDGLETGHASMASRRISAINSKKVGSRAAYYAKLSKNPKKLRAGEYDTVFTPDAVASILNFVGMMSSGFAAIAGYSTFVQKMGTKVASEKFTLADDPHFKDSFNPIIFDQEGVPTRRNLIIENGTFRTFLHNRITATIMNAELTGNAGWVFPQPWNLVIKPGESSEQEMISEIKEGLLVGNVTYIRFQDYIKGDFSGIIRDGVLYIKDGEIKHAVKGLRLSDNLIRWLQNISLIGKEQQQIYHWWLEAKIPVVSVPLLVRKAQYTEAW